MNIKCQAYMAELIGTFLLVLIGCGAVVMSSETIGLLGIAFAFGLTLTLLVIALGPVSGCHINPAVTLGFFMAGKIPLKDAVLYIMMQLAGAVSAGGALYIIATGWDGFTLTTNGFAVNIYGPHAPKAYSAFSAGLVEAIISATLVFVILASVYSVEMKRFSLGIAALAIGMTLMVVHFISAPVTGTSVNIARSFGVAVYVGGEALQQLWLFIVAHIIGAIAGFSAYRLIIVPTSSSIK